MVGVKRVGCPKKKKQTKSTGLTFCLWLWVMTVKGCQRVGRCMCCNLVVSQNHKRKESFIETAPSGGFTMVLRRCSQSDHAVNHSVLHYFLFDVPCWLWCWRTTNIIPQRLSICWVPLPPAPTLEAAAPTRTVRESFGSNLAIHRKGRFDQRFRLVSFGFCFGLCRFGFCSAFRFRFVLGFLCFPLV